MVLCWGGGGASVRLRTPPPGEKLGLCDAPLSEPWTLFSQVTNDGAQWCKHHSSWYTSGMLIEQPGGWGWGYAESSFMGSACMRAVTGSVVRFEWLGVFVLIWLPSHINHLSCVSTASTWSSTSRSNYACVGVRGGDMHCDQGKRRWRTTSISSSCPASVQKWLTVWTLLSHMRY